MEKIENIQEFHENNDAQARIPHPNKKIGILFLVVVGLYIVMSVAMAAFSSLSPMGLQIVSTIAVTLLSVAVPSLVHILHGRQQGDRYNLGKLHKNQILPCILFGIGFCFAMLAVMNIIQSAFMSAGVDLSKSPDNVAVETNTFVNFMLTVICIAVAPAVCEELLCRSAVLYSFRSLGMYKAALWSGLFFALLHVNLTSLPVYVALGFLFGVIAYKTRSVYSTMIIHFVYNFTIIALQSIPTDNVEAAAEQAFTISDPMMWIAVAVFAVIACAFLVPAAIMFVRNCKKNDEAEAEACSMTVTEYLDNYNGIGEPRAPFGTAGVVVSMLILTALMVSVGIYTINLCRA